MTTERLVEIGQELLAIDRAITEAGTAFGNAGYAKSDFWDSNVFSQLDRRRDALRAELIASDI